MRRVPPSPLAAAALPEGDRADLSPAACVRQGFVLRGHYRLADRPDRESSELQVRPREGNADARAGKKNGGDEMAERQPPPGKHEPHEVAENAERSRTDVL